MSDQRPALAVLSTLFPSAQEPVAGVFIRERMFRVARHLPITVISPQPWFPGVGLIRRFVPHYRPERAIYERMDGIEVHRPRFLALPGMLRRLDSLSVALAARPLLRQLQRDGRVDVLDVHFGYPDGHAGALLARWLKLPFVLTLRGKEEKLSKLPPMRQRMATAVREAQRTIAVSEALRQVGIGLGAPEASAVMIGNGIDLDKFSPIPRDEARRRLDLPADAQVLVSVGTLVERKGFHRVVECLPELLAAHPRLVFLIVGGTGPEGDYSAHIRETARAAGIEDRVRFLGAMAPAQLHVPLSAADVFVLATRYEGWANVFLEAMACGLPVVSTQVGGNAEVVCRDDLGLLVPFGDRTALRDAIDSALRRSWNREAILAYAASNTWDRRIAVLLDLFRRVHAEGAATVKT